MLACYTVIVRVPERVGLQQFGAAQATNDQLSYTCTNKQQEQDAHAYCRAAVQTPELQWRQQ